MTVRKKEEQILEKTEMRMLRRIKGVTLTDKVDKQTKQQQQQQQPQPQQQQ